MPEIAAVYLPRPRACRVAQVVSRCTPACVRGGQGPAGRREPSHSLPRPPFAIRPGTDVLGRCLTLTQEPLDQRRVCLDCAEEPRPARNFWRRDLTALWL